MGLLANAVSVSPSLYYDPIKPKIKGREISRLITAAVVNKGFCQLLLTNPKKALTSGYKGETFTLDPEEQDLIVSIQADSLTDFATQISKISDRNARTNGIGYRVSM
jgi:hypothetical protein